jgi:putative acetyltransferase
MSLVDVERRLFREYAAELDAEQCLARLETELAELPGSYTFRHRGVLYLARTTSTGSEDDSSCEKRWVGCVAVRQWSTAIGSTHGSGCDNAAELKRLYVRPAFRHGGIGRALVQAALEFCRTHDYTALRLETLTRSTAAIRLYESLGFVCETNLDDANHNTANYYSDAVVVAYVKRLIEAWRKTAKHVPV